ncbi:hypothetical protein GCM10028800_00160 [Nesterenkonia populi]
MTVAVSGLLAAPAVSAAPVSTPVTPPFASQQVADSSLTWGLRDSFRSYIRGPIAQGGWIVEGIADDDGILTWSGGAGTVDPEDATGSVSFIGGVRYTGHVGYHQEGEPALSAEFTNPTIEFAGDTGTLYFDVESLDLDENIVGGSQIPLAELDFGAGPEVGEDSLSGTAEATLTAEGAEAFAGLYEAGAPLDAVSFDIALTPIAEEESPAAEEQQAEESGSGSTSSGTSSGRSGSSSSNSSSAGSTSSSSSSSSSSNGSGSNASSNPSSSSTRPAPAPGSSGSGGTSGSSSGTAPSAVSAPAQSPGSETVQEDEAYTTETVCTASGVSGATMSWGVRESFRSYIQGGIAQGDWSLSGTSYSGGQYVWSGGAGNFDPDAGTGTVGFAGDVRFTGHDGVLDLSISNPAIEVTGPNSAVLTADVLSTSMDGDRIDLTGVTFASISGSITVTGEQISASGASVTLTGAGADAFVGFYEPGETLDPISFTFPLTEECHEVILGADGQPVAGSSVPGALAQTGASAGDIALGSAALASLGLMLLIMRRSRQSLSLEA